MGLLRRVLGIPDEETEDLQSLHKATSIHRQWLRARQVAYRKAKKEGLRAKANRIIKSTRSSTDINEGVVKQWDE